MRDAVLHLPELRKRAIDAYNSRLRLRNAIFTSPLMLRTMTSGLDSMVTGANGEAIRIQSSPLGGGLDNMLVTIDGSPQMTSQNTWQLSGDSAYVQSIAASHTVPTLGMTTQFAFGNGALAEQGGASTHDLSFLEIEAGPGCIGALILYFAVSARFFIWLARLEYAPWLIFDAAEQIAEVVGAAVVVYAECVGDEL
jgi:hypothetical protein